MVAARDRSDFSVAIICALALEADCVLSLLDTICDTGRTVRLEGDINAYTTGSVGRHNVVVVHMPDMGTISSASVTANLRTSFPNVQLALVVGICGGVPGGPNGDMEVVLGDVMISASLIQYDLGREYPRGFLIRNQVEDTISRASPSIRSMVNKFKTISHQQGIKASIQQYLADVQAKVPASKDPGIEHDRLFEPTYLHQHRSRCGRAIHCECQAMDRVCHEATKTSCDNLGCENVQAIVRERLLKQVDESKSQGTRPLVFFTTIASGNKVMKSARERDRLAKDLGVGAFEMEGAGVWNYLPTIIIKGVCDYADCHKSKQFQSFAAATAAACTKAFLIELTGLIPQKEPETSPATHAVSTVPFPDLTEFIGRSTELHMLEAELFEAHGSRRGAIVGPAGVGKSRLALELASIARAKSPPFSVFWIQATDSLTVDNDFLKIGKALKIPGVEKKDADVKSLVQQQLCQTSSGKWLFILDNADDETLWARNGLLVDCLPLSDTGSILVTTRTRRVGFEHATQHLAELSPMKEEDATILFRQHFPDLDPNSSIALTAELLPKLDYFPLAIVQAAAYMLVNGNTPLEYIDLLQDREENVAELLDEDFRVKDRPSKTVNSTLSTWVISFEQLQLQNPLAVEYLSLMCCIGESQIPKAFLRSGSSAKQTNDAIGALKAYYLVSENNAMFSMHSLVRLATRNWLRARDRLQALTLQAMDRMVAIIPAPTPEERDLFIPYLPHAQALCDSELTKQTEARYTLLQILGRCLFSYGRPKEALEKRLVVLERYESVLGREDKRVWQMYKDVGNAILELGDGKEAAKYLEFAYEKYRTALGKEDDNTVACMFKLSEAYYVNGRLTEAESLSMEVLQIRESLLGPEHIQTANAMRCLAWIYTLQDRHNDAEPLLKKAIKIMESRPRKEDIDYLSTVNDLAVVYENQGRYTEAEKIQAEALESTKSIVGLKHPFTMMQMHNLAVIYYRLERNQEAEDMILQVIETRKEILGPVNELLYGPLDILARIQVALGRIPEALTTWKECLDLMNKLWPLDDEDGQDTIRQTEAKMKRVALRIQEQEEQQVQEEQKVQEEPMEPNDSVTEVDSEEEEATTRKSLKRKRTK